ncbi:MerR family transcriptional regulator [Demequina rhizosphaerae]|uniref:MerR family transcriptional regulator n=1 Tax=Demequina rhizosphaerae TaxID=1638985 RepID=UPI000781B069|nr:MerR family transcriptional regulator [Demequina rhizosphaerae]
MSGYSIDEVAERMGISKHALRYYEREGLLAPVAKGSNGHRRYSEDDLGWIRTLQLLRGTGMPIREMRDFVALAHAGEHTIPERLAVLAHYRDELLVRMAQDRERLEFLDRKLDYYRGMLEARDATPEDVARDASRPAASSR